MSDLVRNERLKFLANWFGAIATAVLTVGVFTPLAIKLYGIGEPPKTATCYFTCLTFASSPRSSYI